MNGINEVRLLGNLGSDPELKHTAAGVAILSISLATSRQWKDRQTGEKRDHTEWHRLKLFDRRAEVLAQYGRKGSRVYISGELRTHKWTGQDGVERYTTEILVQDVRLLDGRPDQERATAPPTGAPPGREEPPPFDDDIPF